MIEQRVAAAAKLPSNSPPGLSLANGFDPSARLPFGFVHDHSRSCIGNGEPKFAAAKQAFRQWAIWTLNMSRIMETVDTENRFGFLYATTPMHVEQGAERFLLEFDPTSGEVHYVLEAISRPRHLFARLGWPLSRHFQHQFVRASHRRMRSEAFAQ
jgi:uncharacterized protein (UPF0548 family)